MLSCDGGGGVLVVPTLAVGVVAAGAVVVIAVSFVSKDAFRVAVAVNVDTVVVAAANVATFAVATAVYFSCFR